MDYDKPIKSQSFTFSDANQSRFYKSLTATSPYPNQTGSTENYFFNNQNAFQYQSQAFNQQHQNYLHQQQQPQPVHPTPQLPLLHPQPQLNGQNNGSHNSFNNFSRQRFTPYHNKRSYANALMQQQSNPQRYYNYISQQFDLENGNGIVGSGLGCTDLQASIGSDLNNNTICSTPSQNTSSFGALVPNSGVVNRSATMNSPYDPVANGNSCVTLQISNLDTSIDERSLKQYLISKLKPITTVLSIYFESISVAKIKLPSAYHAKQVIAFLHRKKIGHKRITVSYTRESSSTEPSTLRCQVAGLLKVIIHFLPHFHIALSLIKIFPIQFHTGHTQLQIIHV